MYKYDALKALAERELNKITNRQTPVSAFLLIDRHGILAKDEYSYEKDTGKSLSASGCDAVLVKKDGKIIIYYSQGASANYYVMFGLSNYLSQQEFNNSLDYKSLVVLASLLILPPNELIKEKLFDPEVISNRYSIPIDVCKQYIQSLEDNDKEFRTAYKSYRQNYLPVSVKTELVQQENDNYEIPLSTKDNVQKINYIPAAPVRYKKFNFFPYFLALLIFIFSVFLVFQFKPKNTNNILLNTSESTTEQTTLQNSESTTELTTQPTTELITEITTVPIIEITTETQNSASSDISNKTVTVTKTGSKYHLPSCYHVSGRSNTRSMTLQEAQNQGYEPCKSCVPDR